MHIYFSIAINVVQGSSQERLTKQEELTRQVTSESCDTDTAHIKFCWHVFTPSTGQMTHSSVSAHSAFIHH